MGKSLYLECYSGISGDMTVAALLDLGADQKVLEEVLDTVPAKGFAWKISRKALSGIDACDFNVILEEDNHDHDMAYLFGENHETHEHHHDHEHSHEHEHNHDHEHSHDHEHNHGHDHHHSHVHRNLNDVYEVIDGTKMTASARTLAKKIFLIIAEAESKAHGLPIEEVHFHEVGAVDSIVDVISIAVCFDNLGITKVYVPNVYEGRGFVRCQHGEIPIPVPAVSNIASEHQINLHFTDMEAELVTPTGAAVLAAITTDKKLPESFAVTKIGIGAGKRAYKRPSMLRAMLIEEQQQEGDWEHDTIIQLESNIDDCSGEVLGHTMDLLLEKGARDVHYVPCFMKKNRPAYLLRVLCKEEDVAALEACIVQETTTIGIRKTVMERSILKRRQVSVETSLGEAQVKVCTLPNGEERFYPEYESCVKLAKQSNKSYQEIYHLILLSCQVKK